MNYRISSIRCHGYYFFPSAEISGDYSRAATKTSLVFTGMLTYSSTINSTHMDTMYRRGKWALQLFMAIIH